jgi:hypothetical protein
MKLDYLKSQLKEVGTSGIGDVFFDRSEVVAKELSLKYPYVFFDLATYKSRLQWVNSLQQTEKVTIKAYILGLYDRRGANEILTIEEKWDELRTFFRDYLVALNATNYISIDNFNDMPNELFDLGLMPGSEIGVSFDLELTLYCNG